MISLNFSRASHKHDATQAVKSGKRGMRLVGRKTVRRNVKMRNWRENRKYEKAEMPGENGALLCFDLFSMDFIHKFHIAFMGIFDTHPPLV